MKNKTILILWVILDVALLIGCVFVTSYWFEITSTLKNPCGKCVEKEKPEIAECIFRPVPEFKIKINLSG